MRAGDFDRGPGHRQFHHLQADRRPVQPASPRTWSRPAANSASATSISNRGITGALVGRQPFGGFGLSGTGTKAGGADYLLHFVEPRSCCENTMRRGFAPGLEDAG